MFYILLDKKPVPVQSPEDWYKWIARRENHVLKQTDFGNVVVITCFIGVDSDKDSNGSPDLFESEVIGGPSNGTRWHYKTYDDAIEGHGRLLKLIVS